MRAKLAAIAFALSTLAASSVSWGQVVVPAEPAPDSPVIAATARPGARTHDGFYLRLGTGFGAHVESINQQSYDPGVVTTGLSSVGELAIGWAVRPGLILGFGAYSATVLASEETMYPEHPIPPDEIMNEVEDFSMFGPMLDYYFDASGGLHLQTSIGVASLRGIGLSSARFDEDEVVVGAGFMVGFGYEWWVTDSWSFGLLGRLAFAAAVDEDDNGVQWEHGVGASPSIVFTATFN